MCIRDRWSHRLRGDDLHEAARAAPEAPEARAAPARAEGREEGGETTEGTGTEESDGSDGSEAQPVRARFCGLCDGRWSSAGHVLRCRHTQLGRRTAVSERIDAGLSAAEAAVPQGKAVAPRAETVEAWREATLENGRSSAVGCMARTPPTPRYGDPPEEPLFEYAEAAEGWQHESRRIDPNAAGAADVRDVDGERMVAWGMLALHKAGEVAAAEGSATRWAVEAAAKLIGPPEMGEDGTTPHVPQIAGGVRHKAHIAAAHIKLAQLTPVEENGVTHTTLEAAAGPRGRWLREAAAERRGWAIYTRRGFRQGGGAARRKVAETIAVSAEGALYDVAPPAMWPWRVSLTMRIVTPAHVLVPEGEEADAAPDEEHDHAYTVTVRLGQKDGGRLHAVVSARAREGHGRGERAIAVSLAPDDEGGDRGVREVFWVHGWPAARAARSERAMCIRTARTALSRIMEQGDGRRGDAAEWKYLRGLLGGEVPQLNAAERAAVRAVADATQKATEAAEQTAAAATTAAAARAAAAHHAAEGLRREATAARAASAQSAQPAVAPEALLAAEGVLGAKAVDGAAAVRKAYRQRALANHPDKTGEDGTAFREIGDAYATVMQASPDATAAEARAGAAERIAAEADGEVAAEGANGAEAVSYTHLTLPTICSV